MSVHTTMRATAAVLATAVASLARAGGDSGTSSMGEMQVSGSHFGMMIGGLVLLGVVIWGIAKVTSK